MNATNSRITNKETIDWWRQKEITKKSVSGRRLFMKKVATGKDVLHECYLLFNVAQDCERRRLLYQKRLIEGKENIKDANYGWTAQWLMEIAGMKRKGRLVRLTPHDVGWAKSGKKRGQKGIEKWHWICTLKKENVLLVSKYHGLYLLRSSNSEFF